MTMTVIVRCQGKRGRCQATLERVTRSSRTVQNVARKAGWVCPDGSTRDLCPECVPPRQPRPCYRCTSRLPFADALGHDKIGHTAANGLDRAGVRTWDDLMRVTPDLLERTPGIGLHSFDRVRTVQRNTARKRSAA